MSKKKRDADMATPGGVTAQTAPFAPVLLLSLSIAEALLALFQWMELIILRGGGSTVCGVNEVINCQKVWDTGFAASVHSTLGVPIAGLGLAWGLAAVGVSLAWTYRLISGRESGAQIVALKLIALAGVVSTVVFAIVSFNAGAVCLTCLGTYALVVVFALAAWRLLPGGVLGEPANLQRGVMWAGGAAVLGYLCVLGPGLATPRMGQSGADRLKGFTASNPDNAAVTDAGVPTDGGAIANTPVPPTPGETVTRPLTQNERDLAEFLRQMPTGEKQQLSNYLGVFRSKSVPPGELPAPRVLQGPKDAPVKIVEWIDIRCPHCRMLNDGLHELQRAAPKGSFSVEARAFPLAAECNPHVHRRDPSNVNCTAAKALICLEPQKDFWTLRSALLTAQSELTTVDKVMDIASSGSLSKSALQTCIASAETTKKLADDVSYAMKYQPQGTPLVTVNGREAMPIIPLLFALIMTGGDGDSPVFQALPGARPFDPHEGHNH